MTLRLYQQVVGSARCSHPPHVAYLSGAEGDALREPRCSPSEDLNSRAAAGTAAPGRFYAQSGRGGEAGAKPQDY